MQKLQYNSSSINLVLSNLNRMVLNLSVLFLDNDIANKKLDVIYVGRNDFDQKRNSVTGHDQSQYIWQSDGLSLEKWYESTWKYGAMPSDNRYAQPTRINITSKSVYRYKKANDFEINIRIDNMTKSMEIAVTNSALSSQIKNFLVEKLSKP